MTIGNYKKQSSKKITGEILDEFKFSAGAFVQVHDSLDLIMRKLYCTLNDGLYPTGLLILV